jgi:hypothetical protein
VDNDAVRKILWTGVLAASTAVASVVANRIASAIWVRIFNEDPPG